MAASPAAEVTATPAAAPATPIALAVAPTAAEVHLRCGLPRTPGGEAWPPKNAAIKVAAPQATAPAPETTNLVIPPASQPSHKISSTTAAVALRRGLPRGPGQNPWPEVTEVYVAVPPTEDPATPELVEALTTPAAVVEPAPTTATDKLEPKRYGPFTLVQWVGGTIVGLLSVVAVAAIVVLGVRWFLGTGTGAGFVEAYAGAAPMPENAPVGFPAWLAWSHFFNLFLMVLIIRSGLQIRAERRPPAYWSPRGGSSKISLTIWFHQSLDLLWVINGVLFIILLFATGQWMRIVPTSWEVIPNALSAGLQYLSLDWPTENGWVHYNGLQQLAYFITVFIAAPLAVVTGIRMSGLWPSKMKKLSTLYPVEVARKLHFPVMLYFVFFIFTHVLLVFATGALRNLNHMFAAQGSPDPATYAANWTGFWLFVLGMVVIAAAWVAARPMLLAPVARLFGTVTTR